MNITRTNSESGSTITLEGDLTIYTVATAKATILDDYESVIDPLTIDVKNITEIDTAGIQLLLFTKKTLSNSNKHLYLTSENPHVDSILENLSLTAYFTQGN
jgi:anti-sigma B factor antagonist